MKDSNDKKTIEGLTRGPGRPRKYRNAAERQKAYRERQISRTFTYEEVSNITVEIIREEMKKANNGDKQDHDFHKNHAYGAFMLWSHLTQDTANTREHALLSAILTEPVS